MRCLDPKPLILVGALMAALVLNSANISPAYVATSSNLNKAECRDRTVLNYDQVLDEMKPRAHPPSPGRLPFGPAGLRLGYLGSRLLAGGGTIGFSLHNEAKGSVRQQTGWLALSTLTVVQKGGKAIRIVGERQQRLGAVINGNSESLRLGAFSVSRHPAFYRLDLVIKHRSAVEHRYREYFRVVPRRVNLRLALSSSTPRPSERLTWRLENFGTVPMSYGVGYEIEKFENGAWMVDPLTPSSFPGVGFLTGAGTTSECQSVILPPEMLPGRYRVSKTASSGSRPRDIVSEFEVSI